MAAIASRPVFIPDKHKFLKLVQVVNETLHAFLSFVSLCRKRITGKIQTSYQIIGVYFG